LESDGGDRQDAMLNSSITETNIIGYWVPCLVSF